MCLAIPGQIVQLSPEDDLATANVSGVKRNVNVALLGPEGVKPGDWVLIHVGFAISKIDEEEARTSLEFLKMLGQAYTDEMAALRASSEGQPGEPASGAADNPAPAASEER
jgi:hydrogenase expression/formation protein HypC